MESIECGFSQCIITPAPNEVYMDGYGFRVTPSEGIRDDLYVKVCAFKFGNDRFVIASFDICGFNNELVRILKDHISALNNLSPENVAICAIHTHAGPACGVLGDLPLNIMYWNIVGEKVGRCVQTAFNNAVCGYFDFNFGKDLIYTYNRRGRNLVDRRVKIGCFFDINGNVKGVLISASCHAVIRTDMLISADFLSILTQKAAIDFPDVPMVFLQGRCADINPYFTENITQDEMCQKLGGELKDSVFGAISKMGNKHNYNYNLRSSICQVTVPMLEYQINNLVNGVRNFEQIYYQSKTLSEKRYPLRALNWNKKILNDVRNNLKSVIEVTIQVMTLSDEIVFVMLPFELFTVTGQSIEDILIEKGYKPESIFVVSYANGTNGYLAPKVEYNYGGYEIIDAPLWYDLPQCSEESEGKVIETVTKLIVDIM